MLPPNSQVSINKASLCLDVLHGPPLAPPRSLSHKSRLSTHHARLRGEDDYFVQGCQLLEQVVDARPFLEAPASHQLKAKEGGEREAVRGEETHNRQRRQERSSFTTMVQGWQLLNAGKLSLGGDQSSALTLKINRVVYQDT